MNETLKEVQYPARKDYAEGLRQQLAEAGMNQSELARRLKCNRSFITNLLSGNYNLTLDMMIKIAWVLEGRDL